MAMAAVLPVYNLLVLEIVEILHVDHLIPKLSEILQAKR